MSFSQGYERRSNANPFGHLSGLSKANQQLLRKLSRESQLSESQQYALVSKLSNKEIQQPGRVQRGKPKVAVPRVGVKKSLPKDHTTRRGRRHYTDIFANQAKIGEENFVPRSTKPVSTDLEKRKLQLQFQFKGGQEGNIIGAAPIEKQIPLSLITEKVKSHSTKSVLSQNKAKQIQLQQNERKRLTKRKELDDLEAQFDQIMNQVEAKKVALNQAKARGASFKIVGKYNSEINFLSGELKRLDTTINALLKQ